MADKARLPRDIQALAKRPGTHRQSSLKPLASPAFEAGTIGVGSRTAGVGESGIASPLTEEAISTREYHPAQTVIQDDGSVLVVKPIKKLVMVDAKNRTVEFNFAIPDLTKL